MRFGALFALLLLYAHSAPADTTLAQAAARSGRLVGSEVEAELLRSDSKYTAVVKREFSIITPQNEMKFGWIGKDRKNYNFSDADSIVDFAAKNGMKVRGHTLVWHKNFPKWFSEGHFTGPELKEILLHHIRTVVGHFKAKRGVFSWDVVNEAIGKDARPRKSIWSGIGLKPLEYVALAFETAHEANPNAELFYNDYGIEEDNAKSEAVLVLLSSLKAHGVPIDGIGFQMHFSYKEPVRIESVRRSFEHFSKLGLKIHITEFDYELPEKPSQEQLEEEARAYRDFSALCVQTPSCKAFVSWGFTDGHSWIPAFFPGSGSALYFDENYRPKAAYSALLQGLTPSGN